MKVHRFHRHLAWPTLAFLSAIVLRRAGLRFTDPWLDYLSDFALCVLPFFLIRPLLRLPFWGRTAGCVLLSPILLLALFFALATAACDSPRLRSDPRLHHDLGLLHFPGYQVRMHQDCSRGGATVGCYVDVWQEFQLAPGLQLRRRIDNAYHGGGALERVGEHAIRVHLPQRDGPPRLHRLNPHPFPAW